MICRGGASDQFALRLGCKTLEALLKLALPAFESLRVESLRDIDGLADDDRDFRERPRDHESIPLDVPGPGGGIGHRHNRPLRHLREQDRPRLSLPDRPARAVRRDGRRYAILRQRLIIIAQSPRTGMRGGAAYRDRPHAPHQHRADLPINRWTDQKAQSDARLPTIEQLLDAEQLMLVPVDRNEGRRALQRCRDVLSSGHADDAAPSPEQTNQAP